MVSDRGQGTRHPLHLDAYRPEKPPCFLFRRPEYIVSDDGVVEQFDRKPLRNGTGGPCGSQTKQNNDCGSSQHPDSVRTAAAKVRLFEGHLIAASQADV